MWSTLASVAFVSAMFDCPPGFERPPSAASLPCYAFGAGPSTKAAAEAFCASFRATLACPSTAEQIAYISQRAVDDDRSYWIGLSDILSEDVWSWPGTCSSKPANATAFPWCPGEPNNGGGGSRSAGTGFGGDCVRVVRQNDDSRHCPPGSWADYRCDASHGQAGRADEFGFVCELDAERAQAYDSVYMKSARATTPSLLHQGSIASADNAIHEGNRERTSRGVQGGGLAWTAVFAVALVASTGANAYLLHRWWRRDRLHLAQGNRGPTDAAACADHELAGMGTSYTAPLRPLGVIDSSSSRV